MPDARGYVESIEANLYVPLSAAAATAFRGGSGGELSDGQSRPAKIRALHSSAALAANVFDFWSGRGREPLDRALAVPSASRALIFEAQFPTGLGGVPPNLDIALELSSGHVVAIESKFTEWMARRPASAAPFAAAYFPRGSSLWAKLGLTTCHELAVSLRAGAVRYQYLDAAQLLKHVAGLATQRPAKWSLRYLYYDLPGRVGDAHRSELADFEHRLGSSLPFQALSYQQFFEGLCGECVGDEAEDYTAWLRTRYFNAAVV